MSTARSPIGPATAKAIHAHAMAQPGSLPDRISDALDAAEYDDDTTMGLTREQAADLRDAIVDAGYHDDVSLRAHDLLHTYVVTGRAF